MTISHITHHKPRHPRASFKPRHPRASFKPRHTRASFRSRHTRARAGIQSNQPSSRHSELLRRIHKATILKQVQDDNRPRHTRASFKPRHTRARAGIQSNLPSSRHYPAGIIQSNHIAI